MGLSLRSAPIVTVVVGVVVLPAERTEALPEELSADLPAQGGAVHERMAVMESRVKACPEDLVEQAARVVERVGVDSVAEGEAVDDDVDSRCPEVPADQAGDHPGHAS